MISARHRYNKQPEKICPNFYSRGPVVHICLVPWFVMTATTPDILMIEEKVACQIKPSEVSSQVSHNPRFPYRDTPTSDGLD